MKQFKYLIFILLIVIFSTNAHAYFLGTNVYVKSGDYGYHTIVNADQPLLQGVAFCIQKDTTVCIGCRYEFTLDTSIKGFSNGDNGSSFLSTQSRWLFGCLANGTLEGYVPEDAGLLQNAIWAYQGYDIDVTDNPYWWLAQADDLPYFEVSIVNIWSGCRGVQ